ncbi:nesprin-1-like [Manduca sexta]|uniref:nesprin-1-like n=1 Tax=Manduca sexta TaxID=7130 RepID=UPI00188FD9F9|nr:nesprin-1-like [Manduca sexta]
MRQDLTPLHEDGEIVEEKLIALRDNLIALGKGEAEIAPAKEQLPDIDRDVSDEHSIVRILELWQAMFRDTFLHYHRLSTALVRSGDAATALRLWHEYLIDLQSFLSGSVPADYENLTEHRRLCRVHKNLLTSQRSVLMNENRETKNKDLADKFDTLTNLHNETLARIVERHDEVCTRIAAWDDYREIYTELLRWLKEMEREKEKLQLRYVHIKRIHKILSKIQNLSDKVPEGKKQTDKLLVDLKKVLEFTEEAYAASVRMEYAGIVKRVDNLQASLDTWRDFLTRILGLIGEYEKLTNDLHKLFSKTQDEIISYSDEERLSRPQLKKAIEKYTDLRTKIEKTETQIEALSVIQEQLKECLSPQDMRIVNQRVWQLRQQRADLEHQLSIIIHRLQERLEIYTIFDSRFKRFSEWLITVESRLESSQSSEITALDPQDLIRRINADIQAETALKEREFEWLAETGNTLIEISKKDEKSYSKNTSKHLRDVQERWQRLQETGRSRIAKITELLETITQLEERLTEIRLKLHVIESKLTTSVVLEYLTSKAVDEKFRDRDEIHKDIEQESGEVGETLNLCELVFNDPDVLKGNFDLRNLRTGVDIVEKKWKNICDISEQRKTALKEIRKSAELATSLLPKIEKKLDSIERRVEKIETRKQRGEPEDESVSKAVVKDLEALQADIKRLEDAYSRVASARGVELRGEGADDAARLRAAVRRWQQLRGRVDAAGADAHRQFVAAHGKAVVALAEADVRLTRALHLAPTPLDKVATLKELDGVQQELLECRALVEEADRLASAVSTVSGVSDMVAEYRALYADVRMRVGPRPSGGRG